MQTTVGELKNPHLRPTKGKVMKTFKIIYLALISATLFVGNSAQAALLTFDDAISGATSYSFDGDGDLINDVIFTTTDSSGFNTVGPGPNQLYIDEPGLEGTTLLSPDLRVDFLNGAITNLSFGFAMSYPLTTPLNVGVTFAVYNNSDTLLGSIYQAADFTLPNGTDPSDFPEALVSLDFLGIASYAVFDFSGSSTRYIVDNFEGTFGSTENIPEVPVPAAVWLFGTALFGLFGFSPRNKAA